MKFGNRVPLKFYVTTGEGESDAGSKGLPYETGSYDAALNDARIENCNVVKYTSVMPTECKEIPKDKGIAMQQWGEVLEAIMAQRNGKKDDVISAAVMVTNVSDPDGKHLGGFACEYSGAGTEIEAKTALEQSISGMIERRGYGKLGKLKFHEDNKTTTGYIIHPGIVWAYKTMRVKKRRGTVIAVLAFCEYDYPEIVSTKKGGRKKKTIKRRRRKHTRRR